MYKFVKDADCGVIFMNIRLDGRCKFKMMLDTGASSTTFDINALLMAEKPTFSNKVFYPITTNF